MKVKDKFCDIKCLDCGTLFPTSKRCYKDRQPYCKKCIYKKTHQQRLQKLKENEESRNSLSSRTCKKCNIEKSIDNFETCFYKNGKSTIRHSCKDCENKAKKDYYQKLVDNNLPLSANKSIENWIVKLLYKAQSRNKTIDIDKEYLLELYKNQDGLCKISGEKLTFHKNNLSTNLSIDRIDSNQGYVRGNVQLVCHYINIMKWNKSVDELVEWCKKIVNKTEG